MAKIATCPKCASQLGLPDSAVSTDRLECPECQTDFLLGETIQIALPVARVREQPIEAASAVSPLSGAEPNSDAQPKPTEPTAPSTSWGKRLKNAIAADDQPQEDRPKEDQPKAGKPDASALPTSPSFEFELEPPAEPISNPLLAPQKTLADFAAKAESKVKSVTVPKPVETVATVTESMQVDFLSADVGQPVRELQETVQETAQETAQTVVRRRTANRRFPKMAAFVVGPVMGGILGLYGLHWMQGDKADPIGLANVLPESALPAAKDAGSSVIGPSVKEKSTLAVAREMMSTPPMKRDQAVRPATAYQPLTTHTTLQQFNASVDAAEAALPAIMQGDLSAAESVQRKGQAYIALCRLAEHFDFAQQPGLAPQVLEKIRHAEQLYQHLSNDAGVRQQLSHIASRWWDYEQRPSQGIFLMGQVQEVRSAGTETLCWIQLEGAAAVPVRIRHTRFQTGDFVGVVGKVVGSSKNSLGGAGADLKKIVEAEYSFKR